MVFGVIVTRRCRLYQVLSPALECFHMPHEKLAGRGFQSPPAEQYHKVFDGDLTFTDLEDVFFQFNADPRIHDYPGHSMMVSDIFEICTDDGSEFFYCDVFGFVEINFDSSRIKSMGTAADGENSG